MHDHGMAFSSFPHVLAQISARALSLSPAPAPAPSAQIEQHQQSAPLRYLHVGFSCYSVAPTSIFIACVSSVERASDDSRMPFASRPRSNISMIQIVWLNEECRRLVF